MEHVYKKSATVDALTDLIRLSVKKLEGLNTLYQLSMDQSELVFAENVTLLNEILDKKQLVIDSIDETDEELANRCSRLGYSSIEDLISQLGKGIVNKMSSDVTKDDCMRLYLDLQEIMHNIKALAADLIQIDNVNRLKAEQYIAEIKNNMQEVSISRKAFTAYNNAAAFKNNGNAAAFGQPVFFDKSK